MSEHGHIKFWQEIGRRNVLRVAAVYIGFSWAVVHSGVVVGEALELPHWIMRFVSAVLIVGFPAVVAFAWVYEMTPEGLKRSDAVEKDISITHRTAHRLNIVIIALMILLAGLYGADRFLLRHEAAEGGEHVATEGAAKAPASEGGVSIAVLPFLNLSSDKDQEFFSDGMTEEITSALAKVKGLKVVGRTSAFEFKGQNKDLRAIGQALGVANLLEGSVRKAGNRVRITGQLIKVADGTHLWTEDYDRELTDIFATQDDIARAIVAALRVPLGLKEGETLISDRAVSPDAYQDYLRAKALVRARRDMTEPVRLLEQIVAHNPEYAAAWAELGLAHALEPVYGPTLRLPPNEFRTAAQEMLAKAEAEGHHAIELDPRSPDAAVSLGTILLLRGKRLEAEDLFQQALKLDAFNPEALHFQQVLSADVGRMHEAVAIGQRLQSIEPTSSVNADIVRILWVDGQTEAALALLRARPPGATTARALAQLYASQGRYKEAADTIANVPAGSFLTTEAAAAVQFLRTAPAAAAKGPLPYLGELSFAYLYVGLPERALDWLGTCLEHEYCASETVYVNQHRDYAAARKTARFKELVRKAGLVDYWRARGWPEFCHPVGADDFACS